MELYWGAFDRKGNKYFRYFEGRVIIQKSEALKGVVLEGLTVWIYPYIYPDNYLSHYSHPLSVFAHLIPARKIYIGILIVRCPEHWLIYKNT